LDFFYGVLTVLIIGVALRIYSMGMANPLSNGFTMSFLGVGMIGALIAELLKLRLTGKHLTAFEVFQNVLLVGFLAASASREELLQAPANWVQLLMMNHLTASVAFLIYCVFNVYTLSSSGKHLSIVSGGMIVATPYVFDWLLIVENVNILQTMANTLTGGLLKSWPVLLENIGRVLVVFGFNEAVVNGIGLVTKGRWLKTLKEHSFILLISLGVVLAPIVADLGSTAAVAALPMLIRALVAILTTSLSFGGLWAEVYLITGVLLDGGKRTAPSWERIFKHVDVGTRKGMAYSAILMSFLYILHMVLINPAVQKVMTSLPIMVGVLSGALLFPLIKTIMETFDGSLPFFERARYSYREAFLYVRGTVVGFGFAYMVSQGMFLKPMSDRIVFGLIIGLVASGGVSFVRDFVYGLRGQGKVQTWKLYLTDSLLGIFVGSAAAFYLDSRQVPVVVEKFKLYVTSGVTPVDYITYPLVNKWGRIDLGTYTGGAKLIFLESLAGVINWSIAAWLFAINKVFMQAYFEKQTAPIKFFFSKDGFAQLVEHMIYVLRWGLWMSPIIFTFLRMMPDPTWYNQDGAIRTFFAIYNNATMSPEAFQAWSLKMFVYVMAFDLFRVLIWMDHMGLRVATLVNLSFLGLDRLDERIAKSIGAASAQRYIPDAVKRFATWAPLLIPFYLPRGRAWDYAWSTSESIQNASRGKGIIYTLQSLSLSEMAMLIVGAVLVCTVLSFVIRSLQSRARKRRVGSYELGNREYKVVLKETGEIYSEASHNRSEVYPPEFDISRRSYDPAEPCGRILFLVDTEQKPENRARFWPVIGNYPKEKFEMSRLLRDEDSLEIINTANGVQTSIRISLPDKDTTAEIWEIKVENLTNAPRKLKMVTYLEWVLNGGLHDRFHTQYARLYPEMEYSSEVNAILTWQKASKAMGFLASETAPEGFLTSRVDFIGRSRSIWSPRVFETMNFLKAQDTAGYPTFDPIGSLMLDFSLDAKGSKTTRLMMAYTKNRKLAVELIQKHLKPKAVKSAASPEKVKRPYLIGHGEIPPGTPQPYSEFIEDGKKLLVHT
ncbi:MAG: hypothetical protein PHN49_12375, partial [Candidatus Omnitrophica bacterium]|nr:hypothetical protein [Candidatus Omnitrophota bacterium]